MDMDITKDIEEGRDKLRRDIAVRVINQAGKDILDIVESLCTTPYQWEGVRKKILTRLNNSLRSIEKDLENYKVLSVTTWTHMYVGEDDKNG